MRAGNLARSQFYSTPTLIHVGHAVRASEETVKGKVKQRNHRPTLFDMILIRGLSLLLQTAVISYIKEATFRNRPCV